jgi:hypothetical protein
MSENNRPVLPVIFLFFVLALVSCKGCKTKPDSNDKTPPKIEWTVINQTSGQESHFTGTAKMNLPQGTSVAITACVVDDGGVKEISSSSNSGFTCQQGNIAQSSGPGLGVVETSQLGLDENGLAWKRYCRLYSASLNFACSPGFTLTGASATFNVKGTNYGGLSSTGNLTIDVPR